LLGLAPTYKLSPEYNFVSVYKYFLNILGALIMKEPLFALIKTFLATSICPPSLECITIKRELSFFISQSSDDISSENGTILI